MRGGEKSKRVLYTEMAFAAIFLPCRSLPPCHALSSLYVRGAINCVCQSCHRLRLSDLNRHNLLALPAPPSVVSPVPLRRLSSRFCVDVPEVVSLSSSFLMPSHFCLPSPCCPPPFSHLPPTSRPLSRMVSFRRCMGAECCGHPPSCGWCCVLRALTGALRPVDRRCSSSGRCQSLTPAHCSIHDLESRFHASLCCATRP